MPNGREELELIHILVERNHCIERALLMAVAHLQKEAEQQERSAQNLSEIIDSIGSAGDLNRILELRASAAEQRRAIAKIINASMGKQ